MISDDLSALFAPTAQGMTQNFSVIMGVVKSFSAVDGTNIITIMGTDVPNVPVIATGAEINLSTGQSVLLGRIGYGFVILGVIVPIGNPAYGQAATATASRWNEVDGFAVPSSLTIINTVTFSVPAWATFAAVSAGFTASIKNNFGADTDLGSMVTVAGFDSQGGPNYGYGHSGSRNQVSAQHHVGFTVTPNGTFTVQSKVISTGAYAADAGNTCALSALAFFTRS